MCRNVACLRNQTDTRPVFVDYSATQSMIIGCGLIIIWPFAAICNGVGIADALMKEDHAYVFYVGSGFWAPVPAFLAGGFALMAAKYKTKRFILGGMVSSAVSIPFNLSLEVAGFFAAVLRARKERDRVRLVIGIMYIVQSALLMALSIWLLVLCHRILPNRCPCCRKRSAVGTTPEPAIELQVRTAPADTVPQPTSNDAPSDMNDCVGLYPNSAECETDMVKDGSTLDPTFLHIPDNQPPPYSEYTAPTKY